MQNYEKNETKIVIQKQDGETKETLKGAKFEILDQDKEVISVEETNEEGKIVLNQIIPGIYYIREIKAPEGYEADGEFQKIEIKMNEIQTLKIENQKIVIQEPLVEEPPKEETTQIEETPEVQVPRLPVTGM